MDPRVSLRSPEGDEREGPRHPFIEVPPTVQAMITTTLARITGRVQGVGFRAWAQDEAAALGLSGWVKNEADGSVTALLSGPSDKVAAMLEKLHRGPPGARVDSVTAEPADPTGSAGFRILS